MQVRDPEEVKQRKAIEFRGVTEQGAAAAAAKRPGEEQQRQATCGTPTARIADETVLPVDSSTRVTTRDEAPKAEDLGNLAGSLAEVDHTPPPAARDTSVAEDGDIWNALTEPGGLEENDSTLLESSESSMARKEKRKAREEEAEEELITAKLQAEKCKFDAVATVAEAKVKIAEIEVKAFLLEKRKKLLEIGVLASEVDKALPFPSTSSGN